jgi:predicted Zn-dependent protease
MALNARLEQLEGNRRAERKVIEELVAYGSRWPTATCQSCHANPAAPGKIPSLDVAGWWAGERLTEILRADGDAARVRDEARRLVEKNPQDVAARLRLAYSLRAAGDTAAAESALRELSWAQFPDRKRIAPSDLIVFP